MKNRNNDLIMIAFIDLKENIYVLYEKDTTKIKINIATK